MGNELTPEKVEQAYNLGRALAQKVDPSLGSSAEVTKLVELLKQPEVRALLEKAQSGRAPAPAPTNLPLPDLDELRAEVDQVESDNAELKALAGKVADLAKSKGLSLDQVEPYVVFGLKILKIALMMGLI